MISVRLPDGRTIKVQTSDPQAAAKAARVMLAREALAKQPQAPNTYLGNLSDAAANGMTLGLANRVADLIPAAATGVGNLAKRAMGQQPQYTAADMYDAARMADNAKARQFSSDHPVSAITAGLLGGLAMPGGEQVGTFVTGGAKAMAGAKGLIPALARGASTTARSAAVGGLLGGVSGGMNADPGQELSGAAHGAKLGAITGAIVPAASAGVGYVLDKAVTPAVNTAVRAVNKATGGGMLDANRVAAQRFAEALRSDGAEPGQITSLMNEWIKSGVTPSLMDVASSLPNGGQATLGLLRGAALKAGPARGMAMAHNDATESSLSGRAIDLARGLTPNKAPAASVAQTLTDARDTLAGEQYPAAHPQAVDTAPVLDAVSGRTGQQAIGEAAKLADAVRSAPESAELNSIRSAANPPPAAPLPAGAENLGPAAQAQVRAQLGLDNGPPLPPTVRLGTLDHVKQALNTMGQDAAARGDNRMAAGLFQRATEIDDHLADVSPDYSIARDNFHQGSNRVEGVKLGRTGLTASPDEYAAGMQDLQGRVNGQGPSPAQLDAGVGYRQEMTDTLAHQPAGAIGALKRIGTAEDQTANLATTYGQDRAAQFQSGVNNLRRQVANSRFIDPSTGSQTAGRASDALDLKDVTLPSRSLVGMALELANKVRRGATLTDEERQALLTLGTQKADPAGISALPMKPAIPSGALTAGMALALPNYAGASQ